MHLLVPLHDLWTYTVNPTEDLSPDQMPKSRSHDHWWSTYYLWGILFLSAACLTQWFLLLINHIGLQYTRWKFPELFCSAELWLCSQVRLVCKGWKLHGSFCGCACSRHCYLHLQYHQKPSEGQERLHAWDSSSSSSICLTLKAGKRKNKEVEREKVKCNLVFLFSHERGAGGNGGQTGRAGG